VVEHVPARVGERFGLAQGQGALVLSGARRRGGRYAALAA